MSVEPDTQPAPLLAIDLWLLLSGFALLTLGLLVVGSASMPIAEEQHRDAFHLIRRHGVAVAIALAAALAAFAVPIGFWLRAGPWLLVGVIILLGLVLLPGLGHEVNGGRRWLSIGGINVQVSELAKLCCLIYVAGYLHRHSDRDERPAHDMIGPVLLLALMVFLLLREPDYGAAAVLVATTFGMLFIATMNPWRFASFLALAVAAMSLLAYAAPYRWRRLLCFLDPWGNSLDCGYQLTQSLIAIGRGGLFGVGLGASIQKHHYLPEAHNDFLFAVLGEELGLVGVLTVLLLYSIIVWRCFRISGRAERRHNMFTACLAYAVGLLLGLQALINIGVNMGMLPTKGLTLPLMSYGRSSMIVVCVALAIVLRIDAEIRADEHRPRRRSLASADPAPAGQSA